MNTLLCLGFNNPLVSLFRFADRDSSTHQQIILLLRIVYILIAQ